jgi:AmmeMemoRadiSam system protein A
MGDQEYQTCRDLGMTLAKLIPDKKTIIIASSDLSHFHGYDEATNMDRKVTGAITDWDYFNLSRNLSARNWEACGGGPMVTAMIAAEKLGATQAKLLKYANSGDIPHGDRSRVVGYSAFALYRSKIPSLKDNQSFSLNEEEQRQLLELARHAVESAVNDDILFEPKADKHESLDIDRGAFVTLKINNQLRGCIGYTAASQPLKTTVRDAAVQAALHDPRFKAVQKEELKDLQYEISVLSPFRKVLNIDQIVIGEHGLLIQQGKRSGLLLPQVAVDQGWDKQTLLEQTCRKARLPRDAWKEEDTDIFMYSAFVFGED